MPKSAYFQTDDLPLELQFDMLVDGELTEPRRRELLNRIDQRPAEWRTLAIRFLQQQSEKQTAKALMKGGNLMPTEIIASAPVRKPIIGRVGWYRITGIAAGLFIAASSALVTLMLMKRAVPKAGTPTEGVAAVHEFQTSIPADVVSAAAAVPVSVPVVRGSDSAGLFPAAPDADVRGNRTSYIIVQPEGKDGYMIIPVSTSKSPVY